MKYLKTFESVSEFKVGDIVKYTEVEEEFRSKFEDYEKTLFIITEINVYTNHIWIYNRLNNETQRVNSEQIELALDTDSETKEFKLKLDMEKYNL